MNSADKTLLYNIINALFKEANKNLDEGYDNLLLDQKMVRITTSRVLSGIASAILEGLTHEGNKDPSPVPSDVGNGEVVALQRPGLLRDRGRPPEDPSAA
jgi:hypothetical protein